MSTKSNPRNTVVTAQEIIADVQRVHKLVGTQFLTSTQYRAHGKHSIMTATRCFDGSWPGVLTAAGLPSRFAPRATEPSTAHPSKMTTFASTGRLSRTKHIVEQVRTKEYSGNVECLKCERVFMSWDRRHNRLCPSCINRIHEDGDEIDFDAAQPYPMLLTQLQLSGYYAA